MNAGGQSLELHHEAGGPRYYLTGEPIHAGDILELKLADGTWIGGRYEWNYEKGTRPLLFVALAAEPQADADVAFRILEQALLRWPKR